VTRISADTITDPNIKDHDLVHPRSAIWPVGSMIADPLASQLAVKVYV